MKLKRGNLTFMNIFRRVSQIATFFIIPGLFAIVFTYIGQIYRAIIDNSFDISIMFWQVLIVGTVLLFTAILGRFFCGFICAFGTMHDFFWFVSQKIFKRKLNISQKADQYLKYLKYLILLFIIFFIWTFDFVTIDNTINPWNIFGMYASLTGWPADNYLLTIGGLLLLLIIIGSMFIERFFCRYLCPLGAIFVPLSRFRIFRINKVRNKCGSCSLCTSQCEMGIPLYGEDIVKSGECINCFTCQNICPKNNARAYPAPKLITTAVVISIAGLYYLGNVGDIRAMLDKVALPILPDNSNQEMGQFQDGVYTGSAPGYKGVTHVQVMVENGHISEIELISTNDDQAWFDMVEAPIISSILSQQATDVEIITGATYSSYALIHAIEDALSINGINDYAIIEQEDNLANDENGTGTGSGNGPRDGTGNGQNRDIEN
jgi:polyferredoxin